MTADIMNLSGSDSGSPIRSNKPANPSRKSGQKPLVNFSDHIPLNGQTPRADAKAEPSAHQKTKTRDAKRDHESSSPTPSSRNKKLNGSDTSRAMKSDRSREASDTTAHDQSKQTDETETSENSAADATDTDNEISNPKAKPDENQETRDTSQSSSDDDISVMANSLIENKAPAQTTPAAVIVISQNPEHPTHTKSEENVNDGHIQYIEPTQTKIFISPSPTTVEKTKSKDQNGEPVASDEHLNTDKVQPQSEMAAKEAEPNESEPNHARKSLVEKEDGSEGKFAALEKSGTTPSHDPKLDHVLEKLDHLSSTYHLSVSHSHTTAEKPATTADRIPYPALPVEIGLRCLSGVKEISIDLAPQELGRVNIVLGVDLQSQAIVNFYVEQPQTLALLKHDAAQIRHSLEQAGLVISDTSLQFSMQNGDSSHSGFSGQSSNAKSNLNHFGRSEPIDSTQSQSFPYQRIQLNQLDLSV